MWVTNAGNNETNWSNKDYDRIIREAGQITDTAARYKKFAEAEKILLQELPILPIYVYTNNHLISEKLKMFTREGELKNWTANIEDKLFLKSFALVK
jgi:oligopeptide transport system substrate-binding protein